MENPEQKTWKVVMALLVAIAFITLSNALVVLTLSLNQIKSEPSIQTSVVSGTSIGEHASAPMLNPQSSRGTQTLIQNLDEIFEDLDSQVKLEKNLFSHIQKGGNAEKIEYIDTLIAWVNERIQHLNETCFEKQGLCIYVSPNHIYMNDFYGNVKTALEEMKDAYESNTVDENVAEGLETLSPQLLGQGLSIQVNAGLSYLEKTRDFTEISILSSIPATEKLLASIRDKVMRELESVSNPTIEALEAEIEEINTDINLLKSKRAKNELKGKSTAEVDAAIANLETEKAELENQIIAEKEKIQAFYNDVIVPILDLNDALLANEVKAKLEGAINNIQQSMNELEPYSVIEGETVEYPEADEAYIMGLQAALNNVSLLLPDSLKNLKEGVFNIYNGESSTVLLDVNLGSGKSHTFGDTDPDLVSYLEALVNALESNRDLWSDPEGGILGIGTWDGEIILINETIDKVIKPLFDQIFKIFDSIETMLDPFEEQINEFISDFYAFVEDLEEAANSISEDVGEAVDTFADVLVDFLEALLEVAEQQAALQEATSRPVVMP